MPVLQGCKQSNHIRFNNGCPLYFVAAEKRYSRICGRGKDRVGRIHGLGLIDTKKERPSEKQYFHIMKTCFSDGLYYTVQSIKYLPEIITLLQHLQAAVFHGHYPVETLSQLVIMGHYNQAGVQFAFQIQHHVQHILRIFTVKVPRRLICQ